MPALLLAIAFVTSVNSLKLLLIILFAAGLLALGRWSSKIAATSQDFPAHTPTPDASLTVPQHGPTVPHRWAWQPQDVSAFFPYDPSLGKFRITKFYFEKSDAVMFPQNRSAFADELHLELYDPGSEHTWSQSYFVATPEGLANLLRERSWKFLFAPQILVFPHYDWEDIRRAVVSRIKADHDFFNNSEDTGDESL